MKKNCFEERYFKIPPLPAPPLPVPLLRNLPFTIFERIERIATIISQKNEIPKFCYRYDLGLCRGS